MTVSPRRRGNRALIAVFGILAVLAVLGIVGGGVVLNARTQLDAPDSTTQPYRSSMIRSSFWFGWYARIRGLGDKLHTGRFRLDSGMGASAIVSRLEGAPDVGVHRLVLPEGLTAQQMAVKVAAATDISAADYLREARGGQFNEPFLAGRAVGASLEGFLFPDTYDVPAGTSAHQLVQMQLDDFGRRVAPLLAAPSAKQSPYQVLTVASMVQSEARFADDGPKVASVIYNRLAAGMALDINSAVMYGLGRPGQSPSADDLKRDTPYNTYVHAGLTPTPISDPGTSAIAAAANPAQTNFLYFVSDGCGHNHYSVTRAEHDQQVARYLGTSC